MDQWLEHWAAEFELSSDTLACLAQKGFASKRTIKKLTGELIRAEFKKLPLGQSMMLEEACESLRDPTPTVQTQTVSTGVDGHSQGPQAGGDVLVGPPVSGPPTSAVSQGGAGAAEQGLTAQDIANIIQQGGSVLSGNVQRGKPVIFDPLQFDNKTKKVNFKDLRDYITLVPKSSASTSDSECIQIGS
jgi:hypothetical protein